MGGRGAGGAGELKPLGLAINEDVLKRRELIAVGDDDDDDDEWDDDWEEQGAVSGVMA